ncbi:MAG: hypothetical protein ACT4PP_10880, partial [Sporichthyaceae bacterium]
GGVCGARGGGVARAGRGTAGGVSARTVINGARGARPVAPRPELRILTPRARRRGRAPFVLLVVFLLTAGLAALLGINTALAQGSFTAGALTAEAAELSDRSQALQARLERAATPDRLAAAASRIGMVPAPEIAYIGVGSGSVSSRPQAAPGAPPPLTRAERLRLAEREEIAAAAEARARVAKAEAAQRKAERERVAAQKAAARKAAAEKAAAEKAAEAQYRERLDKQANGGARAGGEILVDPPNKD